MADDYAPYGVVISDERRAKLMKVMLGQIEEQADIYTPADDVSAKGFETRKGRLGWSDEKHQRHLREIVAKHVKTVMSEAQKFFGREATQVLLAADNGTLAEINRQLPASLKGRTISTDRFDVKSPSKKVLDESLRLFKELENQHSQKLAREVVVLGTGRGGRAVVGTEATLNALQGGQAEVLVVSDKYAGRGWKCASCMQMGSGGKARNCPFCQGQEVAEATDMKEELVELAVRSGARVEFYSGVSELDKYGRVGALLRSR
jgi:peptide subunit release factor 1 (eRF1)